MSFPTRLGISFVNGKDSRFRGNDMVNVSVI